MELTFAPKGRLHIDDAKIIFRNFSGAPSKFNREGDRNFAVIIPDQEMVDELVENGWNVKIKPPREDGDDPFMYLPVKIKYSGDEDEDGNRRGPTAYLISGTNEVRLTEDTIGCLDDVDILSVDLDIRPYDWEMNGKTGRTAYLLGIEVVQDVDRIAARHS